MSEAWISNEDLRPCDGCTGPLGAAFYVIDEAVALADLGRVDMHLGLAQMWGNRPGSEALANVMGPGAVFKVDEATRIRRMYCTACNPLHRARAGDLEAACNIVIQRGWATGHADNVAQLVREVIAQADEQIAKLEYERDQARARVPGREP